MYEIWLGSECDELMLTCETPAAALAALDRVADETAQQLAANGEGAEAFSLHLVVREAATGEVAATFCARSASRQDARLAGRIVGTWARCVGCGSSTSTPCSPGAPAGTTSHGSPSGSGPSPDAFERAEARERLRIARTGRSTSKADAT